MNSYNQLDAKKRSWKKFCDFCQEKALKEKTHSKIPLKKDAYINSDINDNFGFEKTEKVSEESPNQILVEISNIFKEFLTRNIKESHQNKESENQDNPHFNIENNIQYNIEIHKLPEDHDMGPSSQNNNGRNTFLFESHLDFEPLKNPPYKKNCRESSAFSALASYLFRHMTLVSQGENLEDLETEQSIKQNLDLLKFIQQHRPFKNGADEKFLKHENIFEYRWVLQYTISSKAFNRNQKLKESIKQVFKFCYDNNVEIKKYSDNYKKIKDGYSGEDLWLEEDLIVETCNELLQEIEKKFELINSMSFYYIKKQLDVLYRFVESPLKPHTDDEKELIRAFSEEPLSTIRLFVKKYDEKHTPPIFRRPVYFDRVQEAQGLKPINPWRIWTSLLICYYSCIGGLKISLLKRLSLGFDSATEEFFEKLLEDPSSFFMSKDLLTVNWKLIDDLTSLYEKYLDHQKVSKNHSEKDRKKELLETNVFCANLYVYFEAASDDDDEVSSTNFIIIKPLLYNEASKYQNLTSFSSNKSLKEALSSSIMEEIFIQIGKACIETSKTYVKPGKTDEIKKQMEVKKINEVGIDFYSVYSDLKLNKCIKNGLKKAIQNFPSKIIKHFPNGLKNDIKYPPKSPAKPSSNESKEIIKCHFNSTIKDKAETSKEENKGKKVSFFNFEYLREILLEQPLGYLDEQSICIFQRGDSKHEDKVEQNSPKENTNKIYKEEASEYSYNFISDVLLSSGCRMLSGIFIASDQSLQTC